MSGVERHVTLTNIEVVTLAVYLLGGASEPVDTEDIAIKANELAPGRFAWRKYPDQVSFEDVRKRLSDAKRPEKGGYLLASGRNRWALTPEGLEFARKAAGEIPALDLSREPLNAKDRRWVRTERARLLASEVLEKFRGGGIKSLTTEEIEGFFRVDDYIVGDARERKIVRFLNSFADDPELGESVKQLASHLRGR